MFLTCSSLFNIFSFTVFIKFFLIQKSKSSTKSEGRETRGSNYRLKYYNFWFLGKKCIACNLSLGQCSWGQFSPGELSYSLTNITSSYKNKPWVSRKKDKAVKLMIKTKILFWKTIEGDGTVRVRVKFLLFCSELAPTDPWCNMLLDITRTGNPWGGNVRWTPSYVGNKSSERQFSSGPISRGILSGDNY